MANESIYYPGEYGREYEGLVIFYDAMGIGYDHSVGRVVNGAVRFLNVTQTGTILAAALVFTVNNIDEAHNQSIKVRLRGLDYNDYGYLPDNDPFSGRNYTSAQKTQTWGDTHINSRIELNITNVVQEIFNIGGWSSGNALALILEDNGTATDKNRWMIGHPAYLMIRKTATPDFSPTPITIPAPTLPAAENWGIKIAKPGINVLDATEAQQYYTSRKRIFMIKEQAQITTGASPHLIPHGLPYKPFAEVFVQAGSNWFRLPYVNFSGGYNVGYMEITDTNIEIYTTIGNTVYYYIFLDPLKE